jgi:hypothetical protein
MTKIKSWLARGIDFTNLFKQKFYRANFHFSPCTGTPTLAAHSSSIYETVFF